jgi:hypothetical protein
MLLTWLFLPDTTGLDLKEQERRWSYILDGRGDEYRGIAVHSKHLSSWERLRGVGRGYNAETDLKAKIEDLRTEWQHLEALKREKEAVGDDHGLAMVAHDDEFSDEVHGYFRRTSSQEKGDGNESAAKGALAQNGGTAKAGSRGSVTEQGSDEEGQRSGKKDT